MKKIIIALAAMPALLPARASDTPPTDARPVDANAPNRPQGSAGDPV